METISILGIIKMNRLLLTIWKQELSCTEDTYLLTVLQKAYSIVIDEYLNLGADVYTNTYSDMFYKDLYDKVLNKFEEMV